MPDIRNNDPSVCVKKLMVFDIRSNKKIGSGSQLTTCQQPR